MCDKQALCNELQLSCKSKPDRHAHAFTSTQSPTVPLPHEQLPGNSYKAKQRLGCDMDECTQGDSLPGSTHEAVEPKAAEVNKLGAPWACIAAAPLC